MRYWREILIVIGLFGLFAGCGPMDNTFTNENQTDGQVVEKRGKSCLAKGSCKTETGDVCGKKSLDGCWCDALCTQYNDCCDDKKQVCDGESDVNPDNPVASVLTPFDANQNDLGGPSAWLTLYGKRPEIIVSSNGTELDVLAQDYDPKTPHTAVLLHIKPNSSGYEVTQTLTDLPMLDRVMGLAHDAENNRYYATGVDEDDKVDAKYPPLNTYRKDIVRVIKIGASGDIKFNIDLDTARHDFDAKAEMIINPMVAASSRLAVAAGEIALVHGINTDPDSNIGGTRHQKALSTRLDAQNGAITKTSSVWCSHSFDQRLLYDGESIIEHHLGDAFPRYLVFARKHKAYPLFHIKGNLGENNTRTRLGNLAVIENDPVFGYLALFSTENSTKTDKTISGPRNLAMLRVDKKTNAVDQNLPDTLIVTSSGKSQTNYLKWLTKYDEASKLHAERPKMVGIGANRYIVLWEEWQEGNSNQQDKFVGVNAMTIDDKGKTIASAQRITDTHHLHRGDDAFLLDGKAGWMTGNQSKKQLIIHLVDASLNYEIITLK